MENDRKDDRKDDTDARTKDEKGEEARERERRTVSVDRVVASALCSRSFPLNSSASGSGKRSLHMKNGSAREWSRAG